MGDPLSKLTAKRRAFVLAYLGEAMGNACEAARIAGYKNPHPEGSRLLQNDTIRAYLESVSKERVQGSIATAVECQEMLTAIIRGEIGDPETDLAGSFTGMTPPKAKDRIAAVKTLSKMRGYDAPKEVKVSGDAREVLARVRDMERRLAAEIEVEGREVRQMGDGDE